jgi:ATP-dependent helicase/nuclease subunit A
LASLRLFLDNLLAAEESDFSDKDRLLAHVESILGSPFWGRVMKAEKRYFEIPFSIRTSPGELAQLGGNKLGGHMTHLKGSGPLKGAPTSNKRSASGRACLPLILTGTVDLVFWEDKTDGGRAGAEGREASKADGWVIADYKTDRIPIAESDLDRESRELSIERIRAISPEFAAIIDFYAPQVRLYTRFWQQITCEPVKESGLYFTSIDRWVRP